MVCRRVCDFSALLRRHHARTQPLCEKGTDCVALGEKRQAVTLHKVRLDAPICRVLATAKCEMANTLHLTMRDAIVALVLPFLTPARAACSTRAPRSSSTVSAAAPPALDFLLLDHVKVAAAAADAHSRRTELDNSTAVAMKPCRCRRVEPAALPAFALQSRLQRSELAVDTPPSSSRLTASASGCV